MQSQRVIFSLKGTNINVPTRYKIKKYKGPTTKSQKNQDYKNNQKFPTFLEDKDQSISIPLKITATIIQKQLIKQPSKTSNIITKANEVRQSVSLSMKVIEDLSTPTNRKSQFSYKIQQIKKNRQHFSSMKGKRCICGDCNECLKDFAYYLHLFSDNQNLPDISAKSWCIWARKNGKFMYYYGKRIHKVRQIASLTKIVTAMTVIDFLEKYSLLPQKIQYKIKKTSTLVGGTTANLQQGELCSVLDLLYGMMLPSGNDAAVALSQIIGLLAFLKSKGKKIDAYKQEWYEPYNNKNFSYIFIGMMNEKCQKIGTMDTKLFNSHGNDAYDQLRNISTCNQIAKISSQFMTYPLLKEIVKTTQYKKYQNTNKLLDDGFDGIKTGITDSAGPCLAASYKDYIIVVLNSKSMNERWIQVKKLVKWIIKKG